MHGIAGARTTSPAPSIASTSLTLAVGVVHGPTGSETGQP